MAAFPGAVATFAGFTSTHTLAQDNHAAQHNLEQGEIVAVQTKVGTGSSTPSSALVLRGTGVGTSAWQQIILTTDVSGVLPVANGGTGQNTLTGVPLASPAISGTVSGGGTYTTPILTTPVIADFTSATHTHANAGQGGQLTGSTALVNSTVTANKLATGAASAYVSTAETTTSTSFVSLATTTDAVTVTVGVNGLLLVSVSAAIQNSGANYSEVSFALSGANTLAANGDNLQLAFNGTLVFECGATVLLTGLNPGSTTAAIKYLVTAGTGTFSRRHICAVPL